MFEYKVEVYGKENPNYENEFWKLIKEYSSNSNPLLIKSDTKLTLRGLQAEFPDLDIRSLEQITSSSEESLI